MEESIVIGGAAKHQAPDSFQDEEIDSDALAFIRAKKKVDTLHRAKKFDRQHRWKGSLLY